MKTAARQLVCVVILGVIACHHVPSEDLVAAKRDQDLEDWKSRRLSSLLEQDGWLSLIGLEWIEKGSNRVGASPRNEVVIRSDGVPDWLGVIVVERMPRLEGDEVVHAKARFVPKQGAALFHEGKLVEDSIDLHTDQEKNQTILQTGTVEFHLIERGERLAVRVKDARAPTRLAFEGLEYFPSEPSLRIEGSFVPHDKTLPIADVTGSVQQTRSPGTIHFELDGDLLSLDVLEGSPGRYFVIFADDTNGLETYGAGRYLYTDAEDENERIIIDFNRAYNPPCVFTDFATCPLPPRQNRLPVAIRAGEKMYAGGHYVPAPDEQTEE